MTTTIVTRAVKGSPLTWTEGDANFTNLQTTADAALPKAGGTMTGKINFSIGSNQVQYNSVDVGGFYAPQTYSKYLGVGITTDRTWSNTLQTLAGVALGPNGESSLYNNTQSATWLTHGLYVGSDYALKYTTTGGVTPAYIQMSAGQVHFGVCTAAGTAGNSATMLEPLMIDSAGGSAGSVSLLSGQLVFPANQIASSGVNTLDDYEEGSIVITDGSGAGLSISYSNARYQKIGKFVHIMIGTVTYPATADGSNAKLVLTGPPASMNAGSFVAGGMFAFNSGATALGVLIPNNSNTVNVYNTNGSSATNAQLTSRVLYGLTMVYEAAT